MKFEWSVCGCVCVCVCVCAYPRTLFLAAAEKKGGIVRNHSDLKKKKKKEKERKQNYGLKKKVEWGRGQLVSMSSFSNQGTSC